MATKKQDYGNDSISALKGADRVRKRPGVIFGSDGLEGCEHAVFEILSNSIDEAREGHGRTITVTRFADRSIQVEDAGRGCPVDWNEKEQRYNWELVYCELYAGGKYDNVSGDNYEYSLGLNGLGACATQYASRYMDVTVWRDGFEYKLHFERGEIVGELEKKPLPKSQAKKTGTRTRWLPDLDVFTDIAIPAEYFTDVMKRQAVVNAGVTFRFRNETEPGRFEEAEFLYENGIMDYVTELAGEGSLTAPVFWQTEKKGRDRADKPEYKVKLSVACCFSNHRALPQLLLAGARRLPGEGGQVRLCLRHRQVPAGPGEVSEEREQDHLGGHRGLPGAGQQQLLHPDQLREPDQEGHHQQIRPGGHDGVLAEQPGDLLH